MNNFNLFVFQVSMYLFSIAFYLYVVLTAYMCKVATRFHLLSAEFENSVYVILSGFLLFFFPEYLFGAKNVKVKNILSLLSVKF